MRQDQEDRIETMRGRYDAVVERYQAQKDDLQQSIAVKVEAVVTNTEQALHKLDEGLEQMGEIAVERRVRAEIRKSDEGG